MAIQKPFAKRATVRVITDLLGAVPLECQINHNAGVTGHGKAPGFCHSSGRRHRK
jgi:hypothetical protein